MLFRSADSLRFLHLTLDDLLDAPTSELDLLPCHGCNEHGDLALHERYVFDIIEADNPHGFFLFLNLSERLLANLILLVKSLQEDKAVLRRIVPASFESIRCDNDFYFAQELTRHDEESGCWHLSFADKYDHRNKTLEVSPNGVRFLVDLTPKDEPDATPISVASNVYALHELLELQEFVRVNLSDEAAADNDSEDDAEDSASE